MRKLEGSLKSNGESMRNWMQECITWSLIAWRSMPRLIWCCNRLVGELLLLIYHHKFSICGACSDLIIESTTAALKRSRKTYFAGSCRSTYMLDAWFGFTEINSNLLSFWWLWRRSRGMSKGCHT
ncbi:uncharacterized protein LOC114272952 [Camellia sinensis]|uniref:uncharacterized protein LOC114272952 n=1 Tax=Camellia sinensis TaxID=4442 RepID=UPI0010362477|nr:uncharacterized protein LOC114272952 [Camellia sinensis]XP_028070460.1 uncharacterized protein LOC114272952 [Camellia sinensis]